MKTPQRIIKELDALIIPRARVRTINDRNVEIFVDRKHFHSTNMLIRRLGVAGVHYAVKPLSFWQCRFKKYQTIG